ncbi:MAG: 3-isopropylmalate dehydratase small subunit [Chloroflexi bacterium UTCFX4]|jgi:3-isopropylmalate/(R)-2-methylmalate dehydratase small subunit|nr:MAG: 3-isopropylmalate dehydratase small subunit [Chloroflexi bacterium UTCFX4]
MEPIKKFTGKTIHLPNTDVDTDQIIPARYLKVTDKKGLGDVVFYDWRYDAAGNPNPEFLLNKPHAAGATILVAGHNFGCGSSREHAPWALQGFGFQAIVSTQFADIFRNNSLKNGLLPIVVDKATHEQLLDLAVEDPDLQLEVDLETQTLTLPDGRRVEFPIDSFSKECLLNGVDELGYLMRQRDVIEEYERANGK